MLFYFSANTMNLSFSHHITVAHQDNLVRNFVDFMQDVAGNDYVQALFSQRFRQSDGFCACHGIKPVEWLIEHQHWGGMCDGLGQTDAVAHEFAVSGNATMGSIAHSLPGCGFFRQARSVWTTDSAQAQ